MRRLVQEMGGELVRKKELPKVLGARHSNDWVTEPDGTEEGPNSDLRRLCDSLDKCVQLGCHCDRMPLGRLDSSVAGHARRGDVVAAASKSRRKNKKNTTCSGNSFQRGPIMNENY